MKNGEKKFFVPCVHPIKSKQQKPGVRWYVWYLHPADNGSKQVNVYGSFSKLKTVAEKIAHAEELQQHVIELGESYYRYNKYTINHPIIAYIKDNVNRWEPRTYSSYLTKGNIYCQWLCDTNNKPNEYTGEQFLQHLIDQKKNATTINGYRRTLSIIYNKLIKLGKEKINPFKGTGKMKEHKETRMYFTVEQKRALKRVIEPADPQLWLACNLLYYCFIRPKELRLLRIGDIIFSEQKILVRGEIAKNDKTQPVRIPGVLLPQIAHLEKYPLDFYVFGKNGEPGLTKLAENSLYNRHEKMLEKAGIRGERYSIYSWKNTGIYFFLKNKGNIKQLQIQLRHHSLDQVNQYAQDFGLLDCDDIEHRFPEI